MNMDRLIDRSARESWEICADRELKEAVEIRLVSLSPNFSKALQLYFGLGDLDGVRYSMEEIALIHKSNSSFIRRTILIAMCKIESSPRQLGSHARDLGFVDLRNKSCR
jgi:hypothetical protein